MEKKNPRAVPPVLQNSVAALIVALVVALAWIPAACFTPPEIPSAPAMPTVTVPEAPSVEPPKVEPPQAPTPPQTPGMPGGGGNCCLRVGNSNIKKKCQGAETCCTPDYESHGDCEDAKGYWFESKEACEGGC
jgi:hypothetical protein